MEQTNAVAVTRAWGATLLLTMLAGGMLGCSKKETDKPGGGDIVQPTEDCTGAECAQNAQPVNWEDAAPTYSSNLRIVDALGQPIADAVVTVGDRMDKSSADGLARVGPADARSASRVRVEKPGQTPTVTTTTAWKSGRSTQEIGLQPIGEEKAFKADEPVVIGDGGARAEIKSRSLAGADGARATSGKARATYLSREKTGRSSMPAAKGAVDNNGTPSAIDELFGVFYLHFVDDQERPLNLAAGQAAILDFPVPTDAGVKAGDSLPLWSLDENSAEWKKESSCKVEERKRGSEKDLVCKGAVSHFSYWAMASEVDIYAPGSVGCVNTTVSNEKGACFKAAVLSQTLYVCNSQGEDCTSSGPVREAFLPGKGQEPNWCSVMDAANTYRVQLVYDVDASGCEMLDMPPESGRRTLTTDAFKLDSFADTLGSELMLNFTLQGERDCPTLCQQIPFEIKLTDLNSPIWIDHDNDGYFYAPSGPATIVAGEPVDCNDDDARTHPYATEVFCVAEDLNCDGKTQEAAKSHADVSDPQAWNLFCGLCLAVKGNKLDLADELTGNLYDENCDGKIEDRDGDGASEPTDCNDYDSGSSPTEKEVLGNFADEDCDGRILDADDDGVLAPEHVVIAADIGRDAKDFVDCDDFDPATNPSTKPADEAGALVPFYYNRAGTLRRSAAWCSLFDADGLPNATYYRVAKDLSCDGIVTDADGDGFAAAGDLNLGAELAIDCDDMDPRVKPTSVEDVACMPPADLPNDSTCEVNIQPIGEGCPVLTLSGVVLRTACEETKNQDGTGTGAGVCAFSGWWDGNPLGINPGAMWGPCDGDGPMAECPENGQCGGPLPYTDAFTKYIESTYLGGDALYFKGMCFPVCAIP